MNEDLHELPPCILRSFHRQQPSGVTYAGFGSELPDGLGQLLVKGSWSAEVYHTLNNEVKTAKSGGTDIWIDKVRISGF